MPYVKGKSGNPKGGSKAGKPQPNAQLIAARAASKGPEDDQEGDDDQVKRFRNLRRKDPFRFEQFLAQLERDMRAGRSVTVEEPVPASVDVPPPEKEDDGKALQICEAWLKQHGVEDG